MKIVPLMILCSFVTANGQQSPGDLEKRIALLEQKVAKLEASLAATGGGDGNIGDPPGKLSGPNKYGIPDAVVAKIKAKAEKLFPDSFDLQKTVIENEVKAWKELQEK